MFLVKFLSYIFAFIPDPVVMILAHVVCPFFLRLVKK